MSERRPASGAGRVRRAAAVAAGVLLALPLAALLAACSASPASSAMTPGELRAYSLAGTAPVKSGLMSPGDDWKHLHQVLGYYQTHTPQRPAVFLLGGSVARESTINDLNWRRQIVDIGGPTVEAFNLGSMNQSFDDNIAMVKILPDVPTLVIIGVNLGRYTWREVEPEVTAKRIKPDTSGVDLAIQRAPVHPGPHRRRRQEAGARPAVARRALSRLQDELPLQRRAARRARRRSASSAGSTRSSSTCR